MRILIISILLSIALLGCSHHSDPRLVRLEQMASSGDDSARVALDSLLSLDPAQLSDADRHFYDFLSVKIADKAYVNHTSDSLILSVISYEEAHQGNGRYPEALYYGGRVYSDLGDYPTALQYFQQALDELPEDADSNLRCRILSQTGRLLTSLSLYDEAVPYIKSVIEINRQVKDTINSIYNLQLLGGTYLRADNYERAEEMFKEALRLSYNSPVSHTAKSKMYIAAVKYKTGQLDSALYYIRNTVDAVKPIARNSALGYASAIYLKAGILDTAYAYAHELISNEHHTNREVGYQVLLSPGLRKFIQPDTLDQYISDYRTLLETYYENNQIQLAINQQSLHNYRLHERETAKAMKSNKIFKSCIIGSIIVVVILGFAILYFKNRNKAHIIELHEALENITELRKELNDALKQSVSAKQTEQPSKPEKSTENQTQTAPSASVSKNKERDLRERLKNELMALYENVNVDMAVSSIILQSEAYQKLQEFIISGKQIPEQAPLWYEIEQAVLDCSPKFKTNLNLLTLGNLTAIDLHTALLIKCGIKPSKMTTLLGRSNGAIVSRRETLCVKVLDKKYGAKVIDAIIRLL